MVSLYEPATAEDFDAQCYLLANPDVAAAEGNRPEFARRHFDAFGRAEGRLQVSPSALAFIGATRPLKMARAGVALPERQMEFAGRRFSVPCGDDRLPLPHERVSDHEYDPDLGATVDSHPDELYLDVGAGLRTTYRENVVYADVAALVTTDVLCFAEKLPFNDGGFDGTICLSVLEHVQNPFYAAAELLRVTKIDGQLIIDWPFLQPVHGYPDHYFNATASGARLAFEQLGAEVEDQVPYWLHPVYSVHWILSEWRNALEPGVRDEFEALTVGEVLSHEPGVLLFAKWADKLPTGTRSVIAAGTRLTVTRRGRPD